MLALPFPRKAAEQDQGGWRGERHAGTRIGAQQDVKAFEGREAPHVKQHRSGRKETYLVICIGH